MGIIERDELIELVPHKGKMFLLSRVTAYDEKEHSLIAEYDITPDCLFFDVGLSGVPSWVSFEFIAQCISTLSGLDGRIKGQRPKPGCILSVSNMTTTIPVINAGTTVHIEVCEDCRIDNVYTFDGIVSLADKQIASAKLTVMDVDDLSVLENL
jgi:predicted hotdog family 3-hydroxylacyl-ACP dehydratase